MKKLLTCLLSIVMLLTLVCSLSACSTNDVKIEYHIDNFTLDISVPEGTLPENYQEEINKNDFLLENTYDGRTHILVDMTYYDPDVPQDFINPLKESLEKFFPSMKEEIRALSIELTKDYFGTTMSGTEYFHIKLASSKNLSIPITFVSKKTFMLDGVTATLNNGQYVVDKTFNVEPVMSEHELEYKIISFESGSITINISGPSPQITYHFPHNVDNKDALQFELQALGMNVENCDSNQVTFYEKFDTTNDFNNVFPIRTYAFLGIISTVEYKHGSFFTSDGNFTMNVHEIPDGVNISMVIEGQDGTSFELIQNGQRQELTHNNIEFELTDDTVITAKYSNVRWFESITSMLVIIAIILAVMGMIFLAKRR